MKKRGGARKGAGRAHLPKPRPEPPDVDESAVMTLQELADYLNCTTAPPIGLPGAGTFQALGWGRWAATGGF